MATDTVQSYLTKAGLSYNPSDPFASIYPTVLGRNLPNGAKASDWNIHAEAMLRARGLLYWKKSPGDCGLPSTGGGTPGGISALKYGQLGLGTAGSLASLGVIGGSTALGVATAGVGLIALPIIGILQHHEQAVQTEQQIHCSVTQQANQIIGTIDAAVQSGQLDPGSAANLLEQYLQGPLQQLQSIVKTCNAACYFIGFIKAHMDFARNFYYPSFQKATATAAPGGVQSMSPTSGTASLVATPVSLMSGPASVFPQSSSTVGVSSTSITISPWIIIGIIAGIVMLFLLFR